jgi:predicted nucleic acid-binding protein
MVLLDSNLFVIDRFFPRDAHFPINRRFLDSLPTVEAGISTLTLMELCGIASFNLKPRDLQTWLYNFSTVYPVQVLDPWGVDAELSATWMGQFLSDLIDKISRKMSFGDAVLLREAERYGVAAIVTWNTKDFARRTTIPVYTPSTALPHFFSRKNGS